MCFTGSPEFQEFYIDYHARETYWVAEDTKLVTREVADAAIRVLPRRRAPPKKLLRRLDRAGAAQDPGFEARPRAFAAEAAQLVPDLPGVTSRKHQDGDPANNHNVLCARRTASSPAMAPTASFTPSGKAQIQAAMPVTTAASTLRVASPTPIVTAAAISRADRA